MPKLCLGVVSKRPWICLIHLGLTPISQDISDRLYERLRSWQGAGQAMEEIPMVAVVAAAIKMVHHRVVAGRRGLAPQDLARAVAFSVPCFIGVRS